MKLGPHELHSLRGPFHTTSEIKMFKNFWTKTVVWYEGACSPVQELSARRGVDRRSEVGAGHERRRGREKQVGWLSTRAGEAEEEEEEGGADSKDHHGRGKREDNKKTFL